MRMPSFNKIINNPLKLFFIKLVGLITLVFILDQAIGNILEHFYFRQESGDLYRTTFSIEETTADILIFGSSRANHHYDPEVFERRLNLSCHNAGRDGNYIFYHFAVLKGVLSRYSPEIVFLDISSEEFKKDLTSYDRISSLLPYYQRHNEMRSVIEMKSPLERLKLLSGIYPYNSLIVSIAVTNFGLSRERREDSKGYVPLSRTWMHPISISNVSGGYEIDSNKVRIYESFIRKCNKAGVRLYVVCSPYFVKAGKQDTSIALGKEIAIRNNIKFFDHSQDTVIINNPLLFADIVHLNKEGAKIFSSMLADSVIHDFTYSVVNEASQDTDLIAMH